MTWKVKAGIYYQALNLWLKNAHFILILRIEFKKEFGKMQTDEFITPKEIELIDDSAATFWKKWLENLVLNYFKSN